jgi:glucan biosynthesis protein C
MMPPQAPQVARATRRYDLDWLRVIATIVVFLFHCARFFDSLEGWHVKNNQLAPALSGPIQVGSMWMMPLFFVLSGLGTYFSLRSRSATSFVRARFLRLAVPLMTVGWFVLGPPQIYIERVTGSGYNTLPFSGSFLDFLGHYFEGIYGLGGNFALTGVHLWYLFWLFIFSLLLLPIFGFLTSERGRRLVAALAGFAEKPGTIFLFALPMCLPEALLKEGLGLGLKEGGWFLVTYLLLLVLGFLIPADSRFEQAIQRHKGFALALAVLAAVGLMIGDLPSVSVLFGAAGPILGAVLRTFGCWFWLIAILGFGQTWLSFGHPALAYAGEAVLPFYMLHQPVIVIIGYFIRNWDMSIPAKYLLLSSTAFAVIMLLYELLIRRFNLLRFVFGLKSLAKRRSAEGPVAPR